MAGFRDPTKRAKEDLMNKVRNERAERKLAKKKEEASYILQQWLRACLQRQQFLKELRSDCDKYTKSISAYCKQQQQAAASPTSEQKTSDNEREQQQPPIIIETCFVMLRKFNLFYDKSVQQDRTRLTLLLANTLKLLSLPDVEHSNFIAYGFALSDAHRKQTFYQQLHRLWTRVHDTLQLYQTQQQLNVTTHVKILVNFVIAFIDVTKWRLMNNESSNERMTKAVKKNHPSFLRKFICTRPKTFYRDWKNLILFCRSLGLDAIAKNVLHTSVIPTKLSTDALREFAQQILCIPNLASEHGDMFIVRNPQTQKSELSWIWRKCLPLFADDAHSRSPIKISGSTRHIANAAWFVSNCSCLIKAAESMDNAQFEQFVAFFNTLITTYGAQLMQPSASDEDIDEKDAVAYQKGFSYLYEHEVILKLFWSIFDDKMLTDLGLNTATFFTKVTQALDVSLERALVDAVQHNSKNIAARLRFIHHLMISLRSIADIKNKYLSVLAFSTPFCRLLWHVLVAEVGCEPQSPAHIERWKDAIFFNEYVLTVLDLFLMTYNHINFIIEREEFIAQRNPLSCDTQLTPLIRLMRCLFFQHCSQTNQSVTSGSLSQNPNLVNSIRRFIHQLLERNHEHKFAADDAWILEEKELEMWRTDIAGDRDQFGFNVLDKMPYAIPFMERVAFMRSVFKDERAQWDNDPVARILIRREHVVEDGYAAINKLGLAFRKHIKVTFVDEFGQHEQGIDMGGVFKEFLELSTREIFSDNYGLFQRTEKDGLYYPNAVSREVLGEECGHLMEFTGRILAKAVMEGICVDIPFAPFFIGKLFGRVCRVEDLVLYDAELYKNLMFMKHYDGDVADLCLTFTTSKQILDRTIVVDLVHDGRNVEVTNANRIQYIYRLKQYLLDQQFEYQTSYFVQGFYAICNPKLIKIFDPTEFITVLSGTNEEIDVDNWRAFTLYDLPYYGKHHVIKNFWAVVKSMSNDEKKQLLQFTTSNRRPPLAGFKNLQPQFHIQPVSVLTATSNPITSTLQSIFSKKPTKDPLPSSATCFNTLKLPMYTTKKILRDKLLKTIKEAKGFHLS